jgi:hypothetical protein
VQEIDCEMIDLLAAVHFAWHNTKCVQYNNYWLTLSGKNGTFLPCSENAAAGKMAQMRVSL